MRWAVILALTPLLVLLVACGAESGTSLTLEAPVGWYCVQEEDGDGVGVFGFGMRARDGRDVTIRSLSLREPESLVMTDARIIPVRDDDSIVGSETWWPPEDFVDRWDESQTAEGARLSAGQRYNLLVRTQRDGADAVGLATGIYLDYDDQGQHHRQLIPTGVGSAAKSCDEMSRRYPEPIPED